ncbi:MAG: PQQ-binding-like beta-propeller repeat protein [Thermoproteota archaeon]
MRSLWPMFMHDRKHTGRSPYKGAQKGKLKWKFRMEEGTVSSPVIGEDGMVCVTSDEGCLYAVNPDGTLKWKFKTGTFVYSSPAIGEDGTIYFGSDNLYAVNPDGTLKWKFKTGTFVYSSPAIGEDGTIYFGSDNLYAVNPDGTLKWKFKTGTFVYSSPAIGEDDTIYFGDSDNHLYAISSDSNFKWKVRLQGNDLEASPAIGEDGTIYIGASSFFYAINPDGTIKWTFKSMETLGLKCNSCPAIGGDGTIYVTFDENFFAINPDGTKKWGCFQFWQKPGDVPDPSPVIDRDDTIYLGGNRLRAFDVNGFLKWEYDHESGNSHIYPVICGDGVLYAVAEKGKYIKSKGEYRSEYYLYALE